VIDDVSAREWVVSTLGKYNEDLVEERSETAEAEVLTVIRDLVSKGPDVRLAIQDITTEFIARYGAEYERRVTPRWIGSLVRRRLGLKPSRSTGLFTLGPEDVARLKGLYVRYGLEPAATDAADTAPVEEAEPNTSAA
jgi:hypothetical protein